MRRSRTRIAPLFVFVAALALSFAAATTAFAVTGDDIANPADLNDYLGSSLTTEMVPTGVGIGGSGVTGKYHFRVELSAGETLKASVTPSAGVIGLKAIVLSSGSGYRVVESITDGAGVAQLSFMASRTMAYNVYIGTSTLGTFTITPSKVAPVKFTLGSVLVSSKQKVRKSFNVSTKISPRYNGARVPVKFEVQRKVSGRWKAYTSKTGIIAFSLTAPSTYTKVQAPFSFSKAGSYRIRARFADAAHKTPKYTSYKGFSVK